MEKQIKKTEIPTKINILGTEFRIELDNTMEKEEYGETHTKDYIIKLNPLHHAQRKLTFLHECIHAALGVAGVSEMLDEKTEEAIVVCIENALHPYFHVEGLK